MIIFQINRKGAFQKDRKGAFQKEGSKGARGVQQILWIARRQKSAYGNTDSMLYCSSKNIQNVNSLKTLLIKILFLFVLVYNSIIYLLSKRKYFQIRNILIKD